ncbi:MAG: preprotein translocase subunit YajC [Kiritimatiellaeota bacterium]|nr:preprotein translocase subunit YajC [Kiritimatiellota bacterium]
MNTLMMVAAAGQAANPGDMKSILVMVVLMIGLFYFMLWRPKQRQEREHAKLISELRAGERIMFSGGLLGTVTEVREHTFLVEVAPKVNIEIARAAVGRVLGKDEVPSLEERR